MSFGGGVSVPVGRLSKMFGRPVLVAAMIGRSLGELLVPVGSKYRYPVNEDTVPVPFPGSLIRRTWPFHLVRETIEMKLHR